LILSHLLVEEEDFSYYKDLGATEGDRKYLAYLDRLRTEPDDMTSDGTKIYLFFQHLAQTLYSGQQSPQEASQVIMMV
jgi:hypothetical protein